MSTISIKDLLNNKKITKGINNNLFRNKEDATNALNKAVSSIDENKEEYCVNVDIEMNNKQYSFENKLRTKQIFLLESRLFDKTTGKMVGTYLQTVESDSNIIDFDDVWSSTNWDKI